MVTKGPWIVEKLNIKTLPAVLCFVDGKVKGRVVGFDDLGNSDAFETSALEALLAKTGVISPPQSLEARAQKSVFGFAKAARDSDSDDDD